jgi:hypothetical protein
MDLEITILVKADIGAGCLFGIAYILAVPGQSGSSPVLLLQKNWTNESENI